MQLSEKLKWTYCTLIFDNYFNNPALINKLFEDEIHAIGTVWSNQKQMPKLKEDKKMSRGKVIPIVLKTSFAANGTTRSLFSFWQQMFDSMTALHANIIPLPVTMNRKIKINHQSN